MATADSLVRGILAAVVGIMTSIVLFVSVALPAEHVVASFETTTISSEGTMYDLAAPWNMGYSDTVFWMNLLYIVVIAPALLGIIIMFLSAIKTQEYDVYDDENEQGEYGMQAVPQRVTAEEIAFRRQM